MGASADAGMVDRRSLAYSKPPIVKVVSEEIFCTVRRDTDFEMDV